LAAACENGVRLFDTSDGALQYIKAFAKSHKGRLISIAWHQAGKELFTGGSDGTIRRWEVSNGRNTDRIMLERKRRGLAQTIVWSIAVLRFVLTMLIYIYFFVAILKSVS
jgi:WD40 repeat protein